MTLTELSLVLTESSSVGTSGMACVCRLEVCVFALGGGATAQAPGAARLVCADTFTQQRWGLVAVPLPESEATYPLSPPTHYLELRLSLGGEIWASPLRFMEARDT